MKTSIAVVGGGPVSTAIAAHAAARDWAELIVVGEHAEATADDLRAAAAVSRSAATVRAASDLAGASGAEIVLLVDPDADLVALTARCPDAIVIIAGDDVVARTSAVLAATIFPRQRVIGVAGEPESATARARLADARGVAADAIEFALLGSPPSIAVGRDAEQAAQTGAAPGPAALGAAALALADAIVADSRRGMVAAVRCEGEYEIAGVTCVPVLIGAHGIERVVELPLGESELAALRASAV